MNTFLILIKLLSLTLEKTAIECFEKRDDRTIQGRLWGDLAEKYMALTDDINESLQIKRKPIKDDQTG